LFSCPDAGLVPVAAPFCDRFKETIMTKSKSKPRVVDNAPAPQSRVTKLQLLLAELGKSQGASIADMVKRTGWQAHSVRGAMAGSLKKKGHCITSSVVDGVRRYRLDKAAS
jgi:hypothetical protein